MKKRDEEDNRRRNGKSEMRKLIKEDMEKGGRKS